MSDMSMPGPAAAGEGLRVGKVLSRSLVILLKGFPKYILIGAVIALPSLIELLIYDQGPDVGEMHVSLAGREPPDASIAFGVLGFLLYALGQSAMIQGAFQDIRGQPFHLGASVSRGFRRFVPV